MQSLNPGGISYELTSLDSTIEFIEMLVSQAATADFTVPVFVPAVEPKKETLVKPIKVLHVINGEHFSGAERVQQLLGKCLPEFNVSPTFACVKPGKFPELCGLNPDQVLQTPMRGRVDLRVVTELAKTVREQGFEILHAHTPRTALVTSMVSMRTGVPWCYHVHSPASRDSTRGMDNRINDWIERYSIRSCTQLLTVSKSLRREMLRLGVNRNKLTVVPNGVPMIDPIDPGQRLNSTSWRLGLIALMRPRKGVEIALEAMSQINRWGVNVELELIGGFETEEYQRHILGMIEQLNLSNCVKWTGFTKDIASAIRRLDALVLPSLFGEGMPMVVLEALAAAVPVVATKVEGTPEVIRHGVEGLLAEPRSSASLAENICHLISDRSIWAQMSSSAMARHRQFYSDRMMAMRVARVYHRTLR
jgi:glycosyltransferase involved in cell wall biosynthesis